jgi:hypothetical protein
MSLPENTHVAYFPDSKNPERRLTVAYTVNADNTVSFGTAVNQPTEWRRDLVCDTRTQMSATKIKGDNFVRAIGRKLAVTRLNCKRTRESVMCAAGETPIQAVLYHLAMHKNKHIARCARLEIELNMLLESIKSIPTPSFQVLDGNNTAAAE